MVITISSIMEAKNIAYMDKTVYHYVPNDEGLSNSVNVRNLLDILTTTEELKKIHIVSMKKRLNFYVLHM